VTKRKKLAVPVLPKAITIVTVKPNHMPIMMIPPTSVGIEPPFALTYQRRVRLQDGQED
jgi:hypothetical protein